MKTANFKILSVIIVSVFFSLFISCEKEPNGGAGEKLYDIKYSGVLVGSSGHYSVELNGNGENTAQIFFDDNLYVLQNNTAFEENQTGQEFLFTDGEILLTLTTTTDPSRPEIGVSIPGHDVTVTVYEETPENPVRNYTGTGVYTNVFGEEEYQLTTIYNISINGNSFSNIEKIVSSSNASEIGNVSQTSGTVSATETEITFYVQGTPYGITFEKEGNELTRNAMSNTNPENPGDYSKEDIKLTLAN